jgi:hypothetical protein
MSPSLAYLQAIYGIPPLSLSLMEPCCTSIKPEPKPPVKPSPTVKVETKPAAPVDYPLSKLIAGGRGILTAVPFGASSIVGDLVIKAGMEFVFPRTGTWKTRATDDYRYRPLNDDDLIHIDKDSVEVDAGEPPAPADYPISAMSQGQVGVITSAPPASAHRIGSAILRADKDFCLPGEGWLTDQPMYPFRYRPLQPGERIVIEG